MNRLLPRLSQELGRSPTIQELADRLDATPEDVLEARDAAQAYSTTSLDAPIGEGERSPAETVGEEDPSFQLVDRWAAIAPAVKGALPRARTTSALPAVLLGDDAVGDRGGHRRVADARLEYARTLARLRASAEHGSNPEPTRGRSRTPSLRSLSPGRSEALLEDARSTGANEQPDDDECGTRENSPAEQRYDPSDHEDRGDPQTVAAPPVIAKSANMFVPPLSDRSLPAIPIPREIGVKRRPPLPVGLGRQAVGNVPRQRTGGGQRWQANVIAPKERGTRRRGV